jgi:hypothetical protein
MLKFVIAATLGLALAPGAFAQQATYARASLECLMQNRAAVEGVGDPLIFLDVSMCPPAVGGGGSGTEQQTVSKLNQNDSGVSSIMIMTPGNRSCYFDKVGQALAGGGDPVAVDFSSCGG